MLDISQMKIEGLFLDYDGTICPLNVPREESIVPEDTQVILRRISEHIPVGVITTKDLHFILPRTPFATAWGAVGGLEIKIGEKIITDPRVETALPYMSLALEYARHCSNNHLLIEEKKDSTGQTIAFCMDWRHSQDPREAETRAVRVMASCQKPPLNVIRYEGQPFFDVYPCRVDKGRALAGLKRDFGLQHGVMYLGDSKVDNPAFKVADISIGVRHGESSADLLCDYYVKFEDVSSLLQRLVVNNLVFNKDFPEIIHGGNKMKKNIGILIYQTSNSKGQELVAQRMVREFNKLGHKAYLITSIFHDGTAVVPADNLKTGPGYLYAEDSVLGIPVIRVDSYIAKWPPRRIVFRDFIDILGRISADLELNVLITHSTLWNGPEDAAKFVAWRRDMRSLGDYQDPIVLCHMSHFQEPSSQRYSLTELTFRTAWNKLSLSKIMETANLIIVVTPLEKKAKVQMGGRPEKCFLFPGGVNDEVFLKFAAIDTTEFHQRHNIRPETKIISYLGTIEERKNPLGVLKVAEKLKEKQDLHFVLAGRGGSAYAEEVENIARSLPNVSYLGEIEESEKIQLIKNSYLNIIMSHLEALGIAQLEFMFCGVPVITSATGGQTWVVQDGVEGLHVKGAEDIDGAANAINTLVNDASVYQQMSNNARAKASKLTTSRLVAELDAAIDTEMVKESGLAGIPTEVQDTLAKTESALKTWKYGTTGIVATDKRLFIRQGLVSRKVTEVRYGDIKSIEHARKYPWKTLLTGIAVSAFLLIAPSLRPLFSQEFIVQVQYLGQAIAPIFPQWFMSDIIINLLLPLLPLIICIILFILGARHGYSLYGMGIKPIHLSRRFNKAIGFIREFQDKLLNHKS